MPLANPSVNMAGQSSKVGGTVARVFGWITLAIGLAIVLFLGGIMALLGASASALAVVNVPILLVTAVVTWALLRGGKELKKSGDDREQAIKDQAIFALANTRGGTLRAWDVAQALQILPQAADDMLTKLAKEQPDHVTVDVDDEGTILYRFTAVDWARRQAKAIAPTMAPNAVDPNTRLRAPPMQPRIAQEPPKQRVEKIEKTDDPELNALIEAEEAEREAEALKAR